MDQLQTRLGHTFTDVSWLELALKHRSFGEHNNERLEYLGDAVLGMVIAEALFNAFPNAREGHLTRARARLVKEPTLASLARELSLGPCLLLGSGELRSGGRGRDSILSDAFEAVLGAVYQDAGFDVARTVILGLFESRLVDINPTQLEKDPKTRLQEYLQGRSEPLPEYEIVEESGEPHDRFYRVSCTIAGFEPFFGEGQGRRKAEQAAATLALEAIES